MKGKKVIVLLAAVAVLGGAGAAYKMRAGLAHQAVAAHPQPPAPVAASIAPITTNLADGHYIQLGCNVELAGASAAQAFAKLHPAVVNAVLGVLRSRTSQQLNGATGMASLALALGKAIDGVLGGQLVEHIYFTQFVVQ